MKKMASSKKFSNSKLLKELGYIQETNQHSTILMKLCRYRAIHFETCINCSCAKSRSPVQFGTLKYVSQPIPIHYETCIMKSLHRYMYRNMYLSEWRALRKLIRKSVDFSNPLEFRRMQLISIKKLNVKICNYSKL